jgi:signal transduction histidine kinase
MDNIALLTNSKIRIGIQKEQKLAIQIELINVPSIDISVTLLRNQLPVAFVSVISMLILLYFAFELLFFRKFKSIVGKAKEYSSNVQNGNITGIEITPSLVEENNIMSNALEKISDSIIYYDTVLKENLENELEMKKNKALYELASQVAHDIRSPLISLSATVKEMTPLPEETRQIARGSIQRIQDIASSLISKYKQESHQINGIKIKPRLHLLSPALEEIVSEVRMQYSHHKNLAIMSDCERGYNLCAMVDVIGFKRVISNLVNNAVEAIPDRQGEVSIHLFEDPNHKGSVLTTITDNGKGIPPHILKRLGQLGQSYGKEKKDETGSGMGLYYAKKALESWKGKLSIESQIDKGTTVTITLPKAPTPLWFLEKLSLKKSTVLVILDDDKGIHYTWKKKLYDADHSEKTIQQVHCYSSQDLVDWIENRSQDHNKVVYLCDQELAGSPENGLDVIAKMGIDHESILVTNHYDNPDIKKSCRNRNIRIIPKITVDYLPISICKQDSPIRLYDAVYIEDEKYLRMGWESSARKVDKHLLTLASPYGFSDYESQFSKSKTEIYIDSCLGENAIRGEEFAKTLHAKGYKNLFLVTSKPSDEFEEIPYLKWIGKQCPWNREFETALVGM